MADVFFFNFAKPSFYCKSVTVSLLFGSLRRFGSHKLI